MQTIDFERLLQGRDRAQLARDLFPGHKFPEKALRRTEIGKTQLTADQISRLASLLGCRIAELFTGENWRGRFEGDTHTLTSGDYTATLNTTTWVTRLWHKDTLYHESVIHSGAIALSDYIEFLDRLILNHNTDRK